MPKLVRNSSATSRSGDRSRPYARSVTLISAIALSSCVGTIAMLDHPTVKLHSLPLRPAWVHGVGKAAKVRRLGRTLFLATLVHRHTFAVASSLVIAQGPTCPGLHEPLDQRFGLCFADGSRFNSVLSQPRLGGRPPLRRRHSMLPQHPRAFGTGRRGRGQQVNGEEQGCRSYSHHRSTSRGQLLPRRPPRRHCANCSGVVSRYLAAPPTNGIRAAGVLTGRPCAKGGTA